MTTEPIAERELDAARLEIVRRRFMTFALVVGVLSIALAVITYLLIIGLQDRLPRKIEWFSILANIVAGVAVMTIPRRRRRRLENANLERILRSTSLIVLAVAGAQVVGARITADEITELLRQTVGFEGRVSPWYPLMVVLAALHTSAAMIVPWSAWEASRPILAAAVLSAIMIFPLDADSWIFKLGSLSLVFVAGAPGVALSALRYSRFRQWVELSVFRKRYREIERELSFARRLHERLFPPPLLSGPVQVAYRYLPMRQIGGDYLALLPVPGGGQVLVLIDVTGHGVAAALAVNRLHGELKRVLSEKPDVTPSTLLTELNRYIFHTLADQSVFATALALRLTPESATCLYANAGHPRPFVLSADGRAVPLEPTAPLLGVVPPEEYLAEDVPLSLREGERMIAYTDGIIEAESPTGLQLGQERFAEMLCDVARTAKSTGELLTRLERRLHEFRAGPPQDDTLLVAVSLHGGGR